MNVLFVTSQNSKNFSISPFVKSQAESLMAENISVDIFTVKLNGFKGVLNNIKKLRAVKDEYDIIHAHYSTNGMLCILAGCKKKLIVSFLGSDLLGIRINKSKRTKISYLIESISKYVATRAQIIIVKTEQMKNVISKKNHNKTYIIPNGISFINFRPIQQEAAKRELGLSLKLKHVLFLGNPDDLNKNVNLAKQAIHILNDIHIILLTPYPVVPEKVNLYLNAADVLVLTSYSEGSANVVKEALACNLPVISVNVGDVKENIEKCKNCFIVNYCPDEMADKISFILTHKERSNGREFIKNLEVSNIAKLVINLYDKMYDSRN